MRTRVGTRHSALDPVRRIASIAKRVLPLPVGSATMPRRSARSQADSAASWYGRNSTATQWSAVSRGAGAMSANSTPAPRSQLATSAYRWAGARWAPTRGSDTGRVLEIQVLGQSCQQDRTAVESQLHAHRSPDEVS